jgi:hypothetical protein
MSSHQIHNAEVLKRVPDGTIISWLRVPGDRTSAAVAFVRRQIDYADGDPANGLTTVTWISPGNSDDYPAVEDAGINYPAEVVRWGDVAPPLDPMPAWPEPSALSPLLPMIGGGVSSARQIALECAARYSGPSIPPFDSDSVLAVAEEFEKWLDRP